MIGPSLHHRLRDGLLGRLGRDTRPTWQVASRLALVLFIAQLTFTAVIRGYVVPHITPGVHWQYGLANSSDSQVFHEEAASLVQRMRILGWTEISRQQFEGMSHVKILAAIYYLVGSNSPYAVYAVNALLLSVTGLLLLALLLRAGIGAELAALGAVIIACGPMNLFSHSELLREPFLVPALLIFVIGLLALVETPLGADSQAVWKQWIAAGTLISAGFIVASTIRPYLLLLLLVALGVSIGAMIVVGLLAGRRSPFTVTQVVVSIGVVGLLLVGYVPNATRVQQYSDQSVIEAIPAVEGESPDTARRSVIVTNAQGQKVRVDSETWKQIISAKPNKEAFTRADFMLPHWCTIEWQRTAWLPSRLDDKLESLACAREDYLRFCDTVLLGSRADQHCDRVNFNKAMSVLGHVPRAAAFAVLVPLPPMWFHSFGGGGTGLRRIGYVIDGVLDYVLLAGLVLFAWRDRHRHPEVIVVSLAIAAMLTIYALGVPSQFVLARLRLSMFIPLLALGAACWFRRLNERRLRSA
jgi:hypothetical protein